jgi:hypothetical protein
MRISSRGLLLGASDVHDCDPLATRKFLQQDLSAICEPHRISIAKRFRAELNKGHQFDRANS